MAALWAVSERETRAQPSTSTILIPGDNPGHAADIELSKPCERSCAGVEEPVRAAGVEEPVRAAGVEEPVRAAVRCPSSADPRGLVPSGSLAGVPAWRRGQDVRPAV
jgi:hypothetical protein